MMEYDVNRIEFVKSPKTKYIIQTGEHIFQICIDWMFTTVYFQKLLFHYVVTSSVKCFICSVASRLLSSSVFVRRPHLRLYSQILYSTIDFYEWKLNLIWSCKWIVWKRITEHTCWSVGVLLTRHIKFCTCDHSTPKQILACVDTCECDRTPFIDTNNYKGAEGDKRDGKAKKIISNLTKEFGNGSCIYDVRKKRLNFGHRLSPSRLLWKANIPSVFPL